MSVRVVARVRPLLPKELDKDVIVRVDSTEDGRPPNVVKIPSPKNEAEEFAFTFNGVYDQATTQEELFNEEVAPHIKSLFQGLDITLFAYGVTGTGKTHTMRGGMKLADRGVIPRILSHVFRRGKKLAKDSDGLVDVDVALSYYEIYNDKVYDLLEPPEKRTPTGLPLREKDNKTYVVGLSEQRCGDLRDFERLYIAANQNRVTAATKLNAHSSRSHAILRVKLTQTTRSDDGSGAVVAVRESTASAIDLAGSEDNRRTDNGRERLVESAAINKSLFVLSQCVDAIARGEKRIPYRESKMTRILSLGQNNGITVMILNLAPVRSYHLDTLSSLTVSSRAKRIEVREIENEVVFKQLPRSLAASSSTTPSSLTGSAASSTMSLVSSAASTAASSVSSSTSGSGLARQPLRALTSNTHNIQTGNAAARAAADKPAKAFMVYTDHAVAKPPPPPSSTATPSATRPSLPTSNTASSLSSVSSRMGPLSSLSSGRPSLATSKIGAAKARPSEAAESRTADTRTSKLARPSIHPYSASNLARPAPPPAAVSASTPMFSAEQIEAIIERKVAEALAARDQEEQQQQQLRQEMANNNTNTMTLAAGMLAATAGSAQSGDLLSSEAVQKRLEALERRIEDSNAAAARSEDDPRTEGLRFLLLARQHKEVGDDAVALHYYEQALPYFPGQAKLLSKIAKLQAKMARRESSSPRKMARQQQQQQFDQQQPHKRKRAVTAASTVLTTPTTPTFRRIGRMGARAASASDIPATVDVDVAGEHDVDHEGDADADADADAEEDDDDLPAPVPALNYASAPEKSVYYYSPSPRRRAGLTGSRSGSLSGRGLSGRKAAKTSLSSGPGSSSPHGDGDGADADDESRSRAMTMAAMTPRKKKLLDIVNSRDVARIRGLQGMSARTARGLVAYLERGGGLAGAELTSEDDDSEGSNENNDNNNDEDDDVADAETMSRSATPVHHIASLAQLRNVPGVGAETVERAYEGLLAMAI
ncbi:kinesin family member 22 [Sporothrix schenckii 1099-18]|uniref:Kinesin motor domain-containing protein n=2 Tax=Sporothrix schenckii TaxID=29908 RepID=U7PK62_SPOS1|nr:kinesin family member 22 [Sporothrix schenckii 1099-18]ERS94900.1 hypothetical protein HMPREF1624_08798 [Sporothrix schenckii ATCC 58251]KJR88948.1 kinesin family member 22 [Sporothrix schenckii 1099-18]